MIYAKFTQMATFRKVGDRWRAEIARKGVRRSAMFKTKAEAQAWAGKIEFNVTHDARKTLYDAFSRYLETVSNHKRSERWETNCVARFKAQLPDRQLSSLTSDQVAKWRDERLKTVSTGTVRREMNLLGHILSTAAGEWGWIDNNPLSKVRRPDDGESRKRVVTEGELAAFIKEATSPIEKIVAEAFAFAIESGMRAGEIVSIRAENITAKTVMLTRTKNGEERIVPLSGLARKCLPPNGFGLNSAQLDVHFRNVRDRLGQDYTFHSARHTAATRIGASGKITVWELARMFGWRDLKMAMRYVHTSTEDIADRL